MYDLYDRKIEENGVFLLGYCQRKTCGKVMPPFLYTTLRMIRVLTGSAVWRIGERDFRMEKGDIAAVNNIEPRRFVDFSEDFSYSLFAFTPSVFSRYTSCLSFFCDRRENFVPIFGKSEAHFDDMTYLFTLSAKALSENSSDGANRTLVFSLLTALVALMAENRGAHDLRYGSVYTRAQDRRSDRNGTRKTGIDERKALFRAVFPLYGDASFAFCQFRAGGVCRRAFAFRCGNDRAGSRHAKRIRLILGFLQGVRDSLRHAADKIRLIGREP